MAHKTIIAKNQTGGDLPFKKLSMPDGIIPGSGQRDLTAWNRLNEIYDDEELLAYIQAGDVVLDDGTTEYDQEDSELFATDADELDLKHLPGQLGMPPETVIYEHWMSGTVDTDEIGAYGWRHNSNGVGAKIELFGNPGHPGVLRLDGGTAASGHADIHLGDGATANYVIGGSFPTLMEWVVRWRNSISVADLLSTIFGLGVGWGNNGPLDDGLYVQFDPSISPNLQLIANDPGGITTVTGTTAIVLDVWYRVGVQVHPNGGSPFARLFVNGVQEGGDISTNIPVINLGFGAKIDSNGGGTSPRLSMDYNLLQQATNKED